MASVFDGSEAAGAGIKMVTGAADFEQTRVAFTAVIGERAGPKDGRGDLGLVGVGGVSGLDGMRAAG